jgi:hypothetical protein
LILRTAILATTYDIANNDRIKGNLNLLIIGYKAWIDPNSKRKYVDTNIIPTLISLRLDGMFLNIVDLECSM